MVLTEEDINFENKPLWVRQRVNGKLEPVSSYNYFERFLSLEKPRKLTNLLKVLKEEGFKVTIATLKNYSYTWGWFPRALAYDEYLQEKRLERTLKINNKLIDERNEWILEHTNDLKDRLEICKLNMNVAREEIKKIIEQGETDDLQRVERLNRMIVENNKTYNEISDKIMKIYKEDDDKNNNINIVNNTINNNAPINNYIKELENLCKEEDD